MNSTRFARSIKPPATRFGSTLSVRLDTSAPFPVLATSILEDSNRDRRVMPLAFDFFLHFAYLILFLWVLAEQLGVPVPSLPLLLAAGTLTATHKLSFPLILFAAVAGCFVSDSLWYMLGERFGEIG